MSKKYLLLPPTMFGPTTESDDWLLERSPFSELFVAEDNIEADFQRPESKFKTHL